MKFTFRDENSDEVNVDPKEMERVLFEELKREVDEMTVACSIHFESHVLNENLLEKLKSEYPPYVVDAVRKNSLEPDFASMLYERINEACWITTWNDGTWKVVADDIFAILPEKVHVVESVTDDIVTKISRDGSYLEVIRED